MGEIDGQHRVRPQLVEGKRWDFEENKKALLYKALDLCRGDFSGDMGFAVWNIVETWKEVRGELSGTDLSRLDLSKVNFNEVMCSRSDEERYVVAGFNGSLLNAVNLFPQGHSSVVPSAVYSGDGKKILSASSDYSIKEWDAATGRCLRTLKGHSSHVTSAVYSSDGKRILSSSSDNTNKVWNAATGQCVKTYK
ncbi:MAG: kinase, partial [bacterium]|nr:kinase [bacterium]